MAWIPPEQLHSTYVLDGLLYHESDWRIEEHDTDTAGFTDHVVALMHLLGFRFAPRIRDLGDTKLSIFKRDTGYLMVRSFLRRFVRIRAKTRIDVDREVEERQNAPLHT
jgi:TnpA family transposase